MSNEWRGSLTVLLLIAQLSLSACSSAKPAALPPLPTDAKILAFGDSLTAGYGTTTDKAYPAVLSQLIKREVINAGISGETSAEGRSRLAQVLDDHEPRLVILCLGGNDMLRKMDRAEMKANLAAMIEEIRGRGMRVLLLGVPQPALLGLESDPVYAELAQRYELPIENEIFPELLSDKSLKSDQIHLNAQGYAQLAQAIAKLLKGTGAV